jgi:hypothetical protein
MKEQKQISPQRHRDTEKTEAIPKHNLHDKHRQKYIVSLSCFSLCLCVSVVEVFQ